RRRSCITESYAAHPDPLSFPTRRSSDLTPPILQLHDFAERSKIAVHAEDGFGYNDNASFGMAFACPAQMALNPVEIVVGKYAEIDRKSTRLNSSHVKISYAVFCLKKKNV